MNVNLPAHKILSILCCVVLVLGLSFTSITVPRQAFGEEGGADEANQPQASQDAIPSLTAAGTSLSAQWSRITDVSDGRYKIATKLNNAFVLDVAGGKYASGNNVQIYRDGGANVLAQRWILRKVSTDGWYRFYTGLGEHYCLLDVVGNGNPGDGANVALYWPSGSGSPSSSPDSTSVFFFCDGAASGYYGIRCYGNDKLNVRHSSASNGNNVQMWWGRDGLDNNEQWKLIPIYYYVQYDSNYPEDSGTAASTMETQQIHMDLAGVKLTENAFEAPGGYRFNGWNTQPDGSGTSFTDQMKVGYIEPDEAIQGFTGNVTENEGETVTLYAQWAPLDCTLNFYSDDQLIESKEVPYNPNATLPTAEELGLSREGWEFAGWGVGDNLQVMYEDGASMRQIITAGSTADLKAVWKRTVTFVSSGQELTEQQVVNNEDDFEALGISAQSTDDSLLSTQVSERVQLVNGEAYSMVQAPEPLQMSGWNTLGWASTSLAASTPDLSAGAIVEPQHANMFYALYTRPMTLVYDGNGADSGTMEADADIQRYNASGEEMTPAFKTAANGYEREGYEFVGWNTQADGSGEAYEEAQAIKGWDPQLTEDATMTLYAQWQPVDAAQANLAETGQSSGNSRDNLAPLPNTADSLPLVLMLALAVMACVGVFAGLKLRRKQ